MPGEEQNLWDLFVWLLNTTFQFEPISWGSSQLTESSAELVESHFEADVLNR